MTATPNAISRAIKLAALALIAATGPVFAQPTALQTPEISLSSDPVIGVSLQALTALLVLAVIIENALAVLFGWKVYRAYFSVSGTKAVVSFVVAFLVVRHFEVDVIAALLGEYTPGGFYPSTLGTEALTALVIAGGSAGVQNVMVALGYRQRSENADPAPAPPPDNAWITVSVRRNLSVGPVRIAVTEVAIGGDKVPSLAGVALSRRRSLASMLVRNVNRFPANGGYPVTPGLPYEVRVLGKDRTGAGLDQVLAGGPFRLAPGAAVDFDVTM